MEDRDRIGPVIHGDMGADLQGALNMLVIGPSILSPAGKHWNAQVFDQGGGDIVLRAQRVAGAQGHLRPARLERPQEIGRFCRHMETGRNPDPPQGSLLAESRLDMGEHRHELPGPLDPFASLVGEAEICDVVFHSSSRRFVEFLGFVGLIGSSDSMNPINPLNPMNP